MAIIFVKSAVGGFIALNSLKSQLNIVIVGPFKILTTIVKGFGKIDR